MDSGCPGGGVGGWVGDGGPYVVMKHTPKPHFILVSGWWWAQVFVSLSLENLE